MEKVMHSVLVVDDEPIEASVLGDILTDRGLDVRIHTDPVDALALPQPTSGSPTKYVEVVFVKIFSTGLT